MPEKNPEDMTLAELKAAALAEEAKEEAKEAAPAPKAKAAAAPIPEDGPDELDNRDDRREEEVEEEDEPEEFEYRKEIDLGDGSGVQVFKGVGPSKEAALEALADKLADAQRNASKTISDFRKAHPVKEPEKTWDADTEYVYGQRLQKEPLKAFKEIFKEVTGYEPSEQQTRNQQVDELMANYRSQLVQQNFVASHPSYIGDFENGTKMRDWVKSHNYSEFTEDNLAEAFKDLSANGLLNLKSEGENANAATNGKGSQRIAGPKSDGTQTRSSKRGSSIRGSGGTSAVTAGPSEDDLYSMPMEKLKALANKQLAEE
jgi:hypothetical protein